ncbi:MAG: 50S ribosomal protein L11 [Endomicrobium sp.]|jgi:large subunit ribosomal protein L11|nr:50S ribosomal protein L11 [Endomicrobium sp.]
MVSKKIKAIVKLQILSNEASPVPPVGPALGQHGINIMTFCKQFNEKTKTMEKGMIIPVIINIFEDKSFTFILKMPPVSALIKKAVGIVKASGTPNRYKIGKITKLQVEEIAKKKMADLNVNGNIEAAKFMVEGTAKSMGIDIVENE